MRNRKLAKQFNFSVLNGLFPYKFVNKNNLNYIGTVPFQIFFENITKEEFNSYFENYKNNNWNLKLEAIKYCAQGCIALFRVLETFGKYLFDLFQINISNISTIPSLAFKIVRVHYLSNSVVLPVLAGRIFDAISQAYFGGLVDMSVPKNFNKELVSHYDVNGLYPYAMKTFSYPTNLFAHFVGEITKMAEYKDLFKIYF